MSSFHQQPTTRTTIKPPAYKGSVTLFGTTNPLTQDVTRLSQMKFNAVRLDSLIMFANAGRIPAAGPFFVKVDGIKPVCHDNIAGNNKSVIGGVGGNLQGNFPADERLAPLKQTSTHLDTLHGSITATVLGPLGTTLDISVYPGAFISMSISFWEIDEVYSSAD